MLEPMIDPKGPGRRPVGDDEYYSANAKLLHYKDILNNVLRSKNPISYDEFRKKLIETRRNNPSAEPQFIESYDFNEYLSPAEIKGALNDDYEDYIKAITSIRDRGFADDKVKKLFGEKEMNEDVAGLMYGKRFSTLPVVTSLARTSIGGDGNKQTIEDIFSYDPKKKTVNKYSVKK